MKSIFNFFGVKGILGKGSSYRPLINYNWSDTYQVDNQMYAKNLGTGKEQKITIQSGDSLSEEEIQRMVNEAEENAESDKKQKEDVDVRNEADSLIFQTKKSLDELKGISDSEKADVNSKITALEDALKGTNLDDIKSKKDDLSKTAQEIAQKAYEQASAEQPSQEQPADNKGSNKKDDDVVDADFTDVN